MNNPKPMVGEPSLQSSKKEIVKKYLLVYLLWAIVGLLFGMIIAVSATGQDGASAIFIPIGILLGIVIGGVHCLIASVFSKSLNLFIGNTVLFFIVITSVYAAFQYKPDCKHIYNPEQIEEEILKKFPNNHNKRTETQFSEDSCLYYFVYNDMEYAINK